MFADFDKIAVGDTRSLEKTIGEADVRRFVELTGDDNPLHVDASFAETTNFKDIVVHGMLGASFLSTVIGTKLPGPGALWVSQNMEFLHPVRLGDRLTVSCTVARKHERDRLLELDTTIVNQNGQAILKGSAKVKVLAARAVAEATERAEEPRVALVTGGAGGIGSAICRKLAEDGFRVVVNYHGRKERAEALVAELEESGAQAVAVRADLASDDEVRRLVEAAVHGLGGCDVVINNASPGINPKPFAEGNWNDVQHHLDVQLKGAYLIAQAARPHMARHKWGRIVTITSQAAEGVPTPGWLAYATAKGALETMSRSLAMELGPSGITVNCVAPGMTDTTLIGDIPEKAQLLVARQTPMRRLAQPADIAAAVAYLASDVAGFVTGEVFRVNGGMVMA